MNLPKTKRIGYVNVTLSELSEILNEFIKVEWKPVTVCAIHKQESKYYTGEPTFVLVLASEEFSIVEDGQEIPNYNLEY